jgi:hypothetical protein
MASCMKGIELIMYEVDIRHIVHHGNDEDARNRLRAFRTGWTDAINGRQYSPETLKQVTWTNLGWRMGQAIALEFDEDCQKQLFKILADLQIAE